jgi:hypothetical protein
VKNSISKLDLRKINKINSTKITAYNIAYKRLLKLTECTRLQNDYLHAFNSTQTLMAQLEKIWGSRLSRNWVEKKKSTIFITIVGIIF